MFEWDRDWKSEDMVLGGKPGAVWLYYITLYVMPCRFGWWGLCACSSHASQTGMGESGTTPIGKWYLHSQQCFWCTIVELSGVNLGGGGFILFSFSP